MAERSDHFSRRQQADRAAHFVYQLWDDKDTCLYVGMSRSLTGRLTTHAQASWWPAVHHVTADRYPDKATARRAEADLIQQLDPTLNWVHAPKAIGSRSGGGHGYVAFRKSDVVELPEV